MTSLGALSAAAAAASALEPSSNVTIAPVATASAIATGRVFGILMQDQSWDVAGRITTILVPVVVLSVNSTFGRCTFGRCNEITDQTSMTAKTLATQDALNQTYPFQPGQLPGDCQRGKLPDTFYAAIAEAVEISVNTIKGTATAPFETQCTTESAQTAIKDGDSTHHYLPKSLSSLNVAAVEATTVATIAANDAIYAAVNDIQRNDSPQLPQTLADTSRTIARATGAAASIGAIRSIFNRFQPGELSVEVLMTVTAKSASAATLAVLAEFPASAAGYTFSFLGGGKLRWTEEFRNTAKAAAIAATNTTIELLEPTFAAANTDSPKQTSAP